MRIAFLTTEYVTEPNFDGGLANYLHRVSLALSARGHSVEIFVQSDQGDSITHAGIPVHRIPLPRLIRNLSDASRFRHIYRVLRILGMGWQFRIQFMRRHRVQRFDVIQAASYQAVGLGLTRFCPVPMVVRASSYAPLWRLASKASQPTRSQLLAERLEETVMRRADLVYAPSRLIADAITRSVGVPAQVILTPFMIETDRLDASFYDAHLKDKAYLLYFGQIMRLKGSDVLAEALKLAMPALPDMEFVLIGRTNARRGGASAVDHIRAAVGDHVDRLQHFTSLSHNQLYPVIQNARAVVLPSMVDNIPNTCLEAMGLCKLVIGSQGASFEEMIEHGVSGRLFPVGDAGALAKEIECVWKMSDAERVAIGRNAQQAVQRFAPDNVIPQLETMYSSLK